MEQNALNQLAGRQKPYAKILEHVRAALSEGYADVLTKKAGDTTSRALQLQLIEKYLTDTGVTAEGLTHDDLVCRLYDDMAQYGPITPYITDPDIAANVEEINCNAPDDLEVVTEDGYHKLNSVYSSPTAIQDYAKKIMEIAGITLDTSNPLGDGYIDTGVRAAAIFSPCVDDDVGAVLSIRRQSKAKITERELLDGDTASPEEMELIKAFVRYGIPLVFSGPTGSGKTTDMNFFLNCIPNEKRIFVIEDTRELDLVKRDETGKIVSRVVQTKTVDSNDPSKVITMNDLLKMALRFDPDVIVPAEMRDGAAMTAVEASRTGHQVITGLHSLTAPGAYRRILTMCDMSNTNIRDTLLMEMIVEAFPIVIQKKQLPDGSRRIMEIFEATGCKDGHVEGHSLYRFHISDNIYDGDAVTVKGEHIKVDDISVNLAARMIENGAPRNLTQKYTKLVS